MFTLVFLPPYSPDYNPIEQAFSSIKAWLQRTSNTGLSAIGEACRNITPEMAVGWFRASGYM
jgi:transposase